MLEVTELVDGKLGKELTVLLKEYQDITAKQKDLKAVQDKVVARIKEICDHKATYETLDYVFNMDTRKVADGFDKVRLNKEYPNIYEEFVIRRDGISLVMGTIKEKGARA